MKRAVNALRGWECMKLGCQIYCMELGMQTLLCMPIYFINNTRKGSGSLRQILVRFSISPKTSCWPWFPGRRPLRLALGLCRAGQGPVFSISCGICSQMVDRVPDGVALNSPKFMMDLHRPSGHEAVLLVTFSKKVVMVPPLVRVLSSFVSTGFSHIFRWDGFSLLISALSERIVLLLMVCYSRNRNRFTWVFECPGPGWLRSTFSSNRFWSRYGTAICQGFIQFN